MEIVSVCLGLGAEVDTMDSVGQTPLFYAVSHVQADQIVPLLLKAGQYCHGGDGDGDVGDDVGVGLTLKQYLGWSL